MRSIFSTTLAFSLTALLATLLTTLLTGCAASTPSVRLALDGPPLLVAARGDARVMSGAMDRSCMAGVGGILLYDRQAGISCQGHMDRPANDKGRMYVDLACSNGEAVTFVMRNLGPDQGMGIGRFAGTDESITMFYHPCEDEAVRRLDQLREDINVALEKKKQRVEEKSQQ